MPRQNGEHRRLPGSEALPAPPSASSATRRLVKNGALGGPPRPCSKPDSRRSRRMRLSKVILPLSSRRVNLIVNHVFAQRGFELEITENERLRDQVFCGLKRNHNVINCLVTWLPGMDSNHKETSSSGISKLLIRRSATSQESRRNNLIRTAFVQPYADRIQHPP
jgi:hypothetical protein